MAGEGLEPIVLAYTGQPPKQSGTEGANKAYPPEKLNEARMKVIELGVLRFSVSDASSTDWVAGIGRIHMPNNYRRGIDHTVIQVTELETERPPKKKPLWFSLN